jgi:hypothetical protein
MTNIFVSQHKRLDSRPLQFLTVICLKLIGFSVQPHKSWLNIVKYLEKPRELKEKKAIEAHQVQKHYKESGAYKDE